MALPEQVNLKDLSDLPDVGSIQGPSNNLVWRRRVGVTLALTQEAVGYPSQARDSSYHGCYRYSVDVVGMD